MYQTRAKRIFSCVSGVQGATCNECAAGYINYPNCTQCTTAVQCSGKATNVSINDNETACECTCIPGLMGSTCNQCAVDFISYPNCTQCTTVFHCSGKATNVTANANKTACECTCSPGFTGSTCNECAVGYMNYPNCTKYSEAIQQ